MKKSSFTLLVLISFLLSLVSSLASAPPAPALLRVALYDGGGIAPTSEGNLTVVLNALVVKGVIGSVTILLGPDIATKLTRASFDVIVFPGGGGRGEATGIGAAGEAAVVTFVNGGGGYYGTCAGAYLAGTASCCETAAIKSYCNGTIGCGPVSYALKLVDFAATEPWDRGHGYVSVMYTDAAIAVLHLDATVYSNKNISILYYQGPIVDKSYNNNGFTVGSSFTTEIHSLHPAETTGQMLGAPALMMSTFGQGRVLLSPPHPEETIPRMDDVIEAYTLWVGKVI